MKHTPGPWKVRGYKGQYYLIDAHITERECIPVAEVRAGVTVGNAKANAHLIAAAPDLLQALKKTINALQMCHKMEPEEPCAIYQIWNDAKAVVAKIEGK